MRRMILILLAAVLLSGCRTVSDRENYSEFHQMESWMQQMDSLIRKSQTVVQDSSWRDKFIKELQSIREKSDTLRTLVVDTAGRVIKETLIINNLKETTNERYEREIEGLIHSVERMDSTMAVQSMQLSVMDSLLRQHEHEKTVVKEDPWYSRLWQKAKFLLVGIVIGILLTIGRNIWNDFRRIAKKGIDIIKAKP